ncbi:MAG: tRNA (adenosine(37)-N6)-threonylcarbamoyltransferase complex ATPase subunit type 1 TsaE [Armatimonadetes bacterium]|nr:tRNA (adenosine(37)-N6)-threonylcarbamoyltransferase complex ATPase subunit type 1 TsaE [Armatimonadota bacterium]
MEITLPDPEATRSFGERLAAILPPGAAICLFGEMGAGKTTLVQGIARGLGIREPVASPTFTLVHEYQSTPPLYHIDLYRLEEAELDDLGLDEYLENEGIACIEWPDKMAVLPSPRLEIHLTGEDGRQARLEAVGEAFEGVRKGFMKSAGSGD